MKLKETSKIKTRNHVALSPLLHKGGMHESEKPKSQHRRDRKDMKKQLRNIGI
ncbi:hypothetical protein OZX61_03075 [Acinetobacter sp. ESL0695]|uniref:hypothetical protein n=1 Tax=Acinetobacter sp. ESL0695 TaxID=2983215 RepID=UPI0023F3B8F1|nr:hypothetical protein [Acinetobacter sp. ESL0695]WEV49467.1 hypothetical protein OZX61_03075 [Acinetobacter sp. ESL0695]